MRHGLAIAACFSAIGLAGAAIAAEVSGPIPGKVAVVKSSKLAKMVSKAKAIDPDTYDLPDAGTGEDPTLVGATVTFADLGLAAGSAQIVLPAGGWSGLGNPAGSKGYKFKGKAIGNPCTVVLIKEKVIKAVCKGTAVELTTPFAGNHSIVLGIPGGSSAIEYCAEFGGTVKKNTDKITKHKDAPPPASCP